jgi:hypothetical protein
VCRRRRHAGLGTGRNHGRYGMRMRRGAFDGRRAARGQRRFQGYAPVSRAGTLGVVAQRLGIAREHGFGEDQGHCPPFGATEFAALREHRRFSAAIGEGLADVDAGRVLTTQELKKSFEAEFGPIAWQ